MPEETTHELLQKLATEAFLLGYMASTEGFNYADSFFWEHAPMRLPELTMTERTRLLSVPRLDDLKDEMLKRLVP